MRNNIKNDNGNNVAYEYDMFQEYPDVVNVKDLKKMLGIGHVLAHRIVQDGSVKARKVGREYRIPKINVIKYIMENDKR